MKIIDEMLLTVKLEDQAKIVAWGIITSTSPIKVKFAGDSIDTEISLKLASYTPTLNDRVVLLRVSTAWVILGKIA